MKKLISIILFVSATLTYSQTFESIESDQKDINNRYKHISTIEDLDKLTEMVDAKEVEVGDLHLLKASITSTDDLSKMYKQVKKYKYDYSVEEVWDVMTKSSPKEVFDGPKVHFGKLYSEKSNRIHSRDEDDVPTFESNMSLINYLTLPFGLRIAVALKVVRVDREKRELEIAYAQGNTSTGVQILNFEEKDGKAIIIHTSYFKSGHFLRDKLAYKPFHSMTVGEFHKSIKRILDNK